MPTRFDGFRFALPIHGLMVGTFPALGFGDVLTSDPTFGMPAFRTLVSLILNVGIAFEGRCARQLHRD